MTRARSQFVCTECDYRVSRWHGRCPSCHAWNTLVEVKTASTRARGSSAPGRPGLWVHGQQAEPVPIDALEETTISRLSTGFEELDRVLGGGVVPGTLILLGGDPGIGKSTLLLQVMQNMANSYGCCLYVTGEESVEQVRIRSQRLKTPAPELYVLAETDLAAIEAAIYKLNPKAVVIDSIQTVFHPEHDGAPGSVGQVRECAAHLLRLAKTTGVAIWIIGHVTKGGDLAGPRTLEHATDVVLYFEGERHYAHRVVRAVKNRFGSTYDMGLFEMSDRGLQQVLDPSEVFLAGRPDDTTGSAVVASMEGSRPLLVEVQALLVPSPFNHPRRTVSGLDANRLAFILAVLERRAGLAVGPQDVYVKVSGGARVHEPAADLAVALAIASSFRNQPLPRDVVVMGEIGLSGEIRAVNRIEERLRESARLGFSTCLIPESSRRSLSPSRTIPVEIVGVTTLAGALEVIFA